MCELARRGAPPEIGPERGGGGGGGARPLRALFQPGEKEEEKGTSVLRERRGREERGERARKVQRRNTTTTKKVTEKNTTATKKSCVN